MPIMVTAFYAALNATFSVALGFAVSVKRAQTDIYLGTGDDPALLLAARRHGNNAEYVALFLVVMLIAELAGGNQWALQAIGGVFTLGRILHAIGVGPVVSLKRGIGALLGWVSIAAGAIYGFVLVVK